jgi:hypothetical protein
MKTGQFLIKPASAIVVAAFLTFPMLSSAQSNASASGRLDTRPVCVYKGVMSDAEIEVCTGHRIHYYYATDSGRAPAWASAGSTVQQATKSSRASRPRSKATIVRVR